MSDATDNRFYREKQEQPSSKERLSLDEIKVWLRERHNYLVGISVKETYEGDAHAHIESLQLKLQQSTLERDAMLEDIAALRMAERMNVETVAKLQQERDELQRDIEADFMQGAYARLKRLQQAEQERDGLKAKIDALMLEFCPGEMSASISVLAREINALPERVRSFIHDLEARADPAGDVRRAHVAEENAAALAVEVERLQQERDGLQQFHDWALPQITDLRRAQPPNAPRVITPVFMICVAYESGFGHGRDQDNLPNPYSEGTEEHEAYKVGYDEGYDRRWRNQQPNASEIPSSRLRAAIGDAVTKEGRCHCGSHEWGPNTTKITDSHGRLHFTDHCSVETNVPLVPKGHFWRGPEDRDRCENCGRSYFAHRRDDDGNWCPVSETT